MGLRLRKSIRVGKHARINLSNSGVGYSVGAGGVRYTQSPKRLKSKRGGGFLGAIFVGTYLLFKWTFIIALFPITIPIMIIRRRERKKETHGIRSSASQAENEHFDLMPKIDELYSSVMHSKDYTGSKAKQLEALCERDISLAPDVWRSMKQKSPQLQSHPTYPSHRQLATLYERRGEYDKAIAVCHKAIQDGFNDDGTQMKMSGRIERIKEKAAK